jgi:hypothetical protein
MISLRASNRFRRGVLVGALAIVLTEIGLFVCLWRLGVLVDPGADRTAALAFIVLGTAVTLQAMGAVGAVWIMVAMAWTTLSHDIVGLTLEHPWRRWQGSWSGVSHAWHQRGWLVLKARGQWRRWYVRTDRDSDAVLAEVRRQLPEGVWLEGAAPRRHLLTTTVPLVVACVVVGGLLLIGVLSALRSLSGHSP